jgi:hypothetical protein
MQIKSALKTKTKSIFINTIGKRLLLLGSKKWLSNLYGFSPNKKEKEIQPKKQERKRNNVLQTKDSTPLFCTNYPPFQIYNYNMVVKTWHETATALDRQSPSSWVSVIYMVMVNK